MSEVVLRETSMGNGSDTAIITIDAESAEHLHHELSDIEIFNVCHLHGHYYFRIFIFFSAILPRYLCIMS